MAVQVKLKMAQEHADTKLAEELEHTWVDATEAVEELLTPHPAASVDTQALASRISCASGASHGTDAQRVGTVVHSTSDGGINNT